MRLIREYKGQRVRQTICVGDQIAVILEGAPGQPGERLILQLADYLANLQRRHEKKGPGLGVPDVIKVEATTLPGSGPAEIPQTL